MTGRMRRKFTDEFKAETVRLVLQLPPREGKCLRQDSVTKAAA